MSHRVPIGTSQIIGTETALSMPITLWCSSFGRLPQILGAIIIVGVIIQVSLEPRDKDHQGERHDEHEWEENHEADSFALRGRPQVGAAACCNGSHQHDREHGGDPEPKLEARRLGPLMFVGLRHGFFGSPQNVANTSIVDYPDSFNFSCHCRR